MSRIVVLLLVSSVNDVSSRLDVTPPLLIVFKLLFPSLCACDVLKLGTRRPVRDTRAWQFAASALPSRPSPLRPPRFPLPSSGPLGEPTGKAQHNLLFALLTHVPHEVCLPVYLLVQSTTVHVQGAFCGRMSAAGRACGVPAARRYVAVAPRSECASNTWVSMPAAVIRANSRLASRSDPRHWLGTVRYRNRNNSGWGRCRVRYFSSVVWVGPWMLKVIA